MRPARLASAFLLVLLLAWFPATAFAHAYPVTSSPAPDTTVATPPARVQIWFDENLEPQFSSIVVYDAQRREVQTGPGRVDPSDPKVLSVAVRPNLPSGTYTVVWHVVSADDGHSTAGVFAFGLRVAPKAPAVSPQQLGAASGQEATLPGVVGRWLTYLAFALVLGSATFALGVTGRDAGGTDGTEGLRTLRLGATALLTLGQALRLIDEATLAASGGERAGSGPSLVAVVLGTRFGALWLGRLALVGLGLVLLARAPASPAGCPPSETRRRSVAWLLVGFGLAADLAWSGHAAAGSIFAYARLIQSTLGWAARSGLYLPIAAALVRAAPTLDLIADGLHLIAIAAWVGGLVALVVATRGRSGDLGTLVTRFSRLATIAVVVVLLTGLYNTWLYLSGPAAYASTGYGESLLAKHAAIVALLLAASISRFVTVPLLNSRPPAIPLPGRVRPFLIGHPRFSVRVEAGLGVAVLLATGVLTSLGPTRAPQQVLAAPDRELALEAAPFTTSFDLGEDEQARVTLDPGRVGPNDYEVDLTRAGAPAAGVMRVYLELTPLGIGPAASDVIELQPGGGGRFTGSGLAPSADGVWQVAVHVYRSDGSIGRGRGSFQADTRWAAVATPAARDLLARAQAAMDRLRTARMVEQLGNGAGGLVLDDYTFAAPSGQEISGPTAGDVVQIGTTRYQRQPGSSAWSRETGVAEYHWPEGAYAELTQGVGGLVVGEGTVQGVPCTIVAFYSPRVEGIYEEWIGRDDDLVHQEIMAAPSHFMVNLYYDFNRPTQLTPPVGASSG